MALKLRALQHREVCCLILIMAAHWATNKKQRSHNPMEWQIWICGWPWEGAEVEIAATSGRARSDHWQISAEMSGVQPSGHSHRRLLSCVGIQFEINNRITTQAIGSEQQSKFIVHSFGICCVTHYLGRSSGTNGGRLRWMKWLRRSKKKSVM